MDRHGCLTVFKGREILRHSHRNRCIAGNNFFYKAAHGFKTEGKRCDVKQEPVFITAVAGKKISLECCSDRHHFIRIDIGQRFAVKVIGHRLADAGHAS